MNKVAVEYAAHDIVDMSFPLEYARALANAIHAVVDATENEEL